MRPLPAVAGVLIALLLFSTLYGMVRAWVWALGRVRRGEALLPPPTPRPVPWGTASVVLIIVTWLVVNAGVAWAYMSVTGGVAVAAPEAAKGAPRSGPRSMTFTEQMFLVSLINGILLLVVPALLRLTSRARLADLGIRREGL